ncbi:MAG TPA: hypothetical protein VGL61_14750 [Kofleriaceae bacterium]|jgi:hypothetical protein
MWRFAWPLLALVACGTTDDDRPRDAQYITDTILAPMCGQAECHSTFVQSDGVVFDTYEGMRESMIAPGMNDANPNGPVVGPLLAFDDSPYDPAAPQESLLIQILTQTTDPNTGIDRMPLDAPLANADIQLLEAWIRGPVADDEAPCGALLACPSINDQCSIPDGETTGECVYYPQPALGAECNPNANGGLACNDDNLMMCGDDWNFGALVQLCAGGCEAGACL